MIDKGLASFVHAALEDNSHAQDLAYIQYKYDFVPLFVYGPEKKDFSRHKLLETWPRVGVGATEHSHYILGRDTWNHPVMMNWPTHPEAARIKGEVYVVSAEMLFRMDAEYETGLAFRRIKRSVVYLVPPTKRPEDAGTNPMAHYRRSECWMYVGKNDFFTPKFEKGDVKRLYSLLPAETAEINTAYFIWSGMEDDNLRKSMEQH